MVFVGKTSDSVVKQENNTSCREGARLFLSKRRTALHVQIYGLDLTLMMVLHALRQNSDLRVLICSEFKFKFELGVDRIYYCRVKPFINTVIASVEQSCLADIQVFLATSPKTQSCPMYRYSKDLQLGGDGHVALLLLFFLPSHFHAASLLTACTLVFTIYPVPVLFDLVSHSSEAVSTGAAIQAIAIYYSILTEPVPVVIHSTSSYGVVDHAALKMQLTQNSSRHTSLVASSTCTYAYVQAYFQNNTLPADGVICEVETELFSAAPYPHILGRSIHD
ncbi:hypothetical protein IW261DRAFT_1599231 [Armillaria novae-zelandiae]|uniref:Uncharacterized protein n=1 Tax=Armillaria novae-zelandiae TaxID=153914 RepID=A0AA39NAQ3_9AGAR|nr:hypothetical protein IW261DRAFT_1599231 [Armillaria novae-zelandiae]